MDPKQPSSDRPNTLGKAWRQLSQPRPRKVADLPLLPDWPPLPEEKSRVGWPVSGADAAPHIQPSGADADQQTDHREAVQPLSALGIRRQRMDLQDRWRLASRRARLGIAGAVIVSVLLIAACSSLALHALGAVGSSVSPAALGASATQQASAPGGASSHAPTAAASPKTTATSAATAASTRAPTLPLTITFTCTTGSIRGTGKVCVQTAPSATVSLSVRYCDGSTAKGLRSAGTADANGAYTWSWSVHMTCVGPATATVTAKRGGVSTTATKTFTITA